MDSDSDSSSVELECPPGSDLNYLRVSSTTSVIQPVPATSKGVPPKLILGVEVTSSASASVSVHLPVKSDTGVAKAKPKKARLETRREYKANLKRRLKAASASTKANLKRRLLQNQSAKTK